MDALQFNIQKIAEIYRRPAFRSADASPHARYKGQKSAVGMRLRGKRRYWRVQHLL